MHLLICSYVFQFFQKKRKRGQRRKKAPLAREETKADNEELAKVEAEVEVEVNSSEAEAANKVCGSKAETNSTKVEGQNQYQIGSKRAKGIIQPLPEDVQAETKDKPGKDLTKEEILAQREAKKAAKKVGSAAQPNKKASEEKEGKSKAELKAERRAKQEAQRAAKVIKCVNRPRLGDFIWRAFHTRFFL